MAVVQVGQLVEGFVSRRAVRKLVIVRIPAHGCEALLHMNNISREEFSEEVLGTLFTKGDSLKVCAPALNHLSRTMGCAHAALTQPTAHKNSLL